MHNLVFIPTLFILAGLAFLSATATITGADGGNIKVVKAKAESQFPDGIKFSIEANSDSEIDDIRVFLAKWARKVAVPIGPSPLKVSAV